MKNSHLLLAIDLGASGTKIVGSIVGEAGCKAGLMTPHCIEVDGALDREPLFDRHNVWVKIGAKSYAVGNLAHIKYEATNKLKPAKFTTAVPKICAAIAVAAQAFALPAKFDLSISFVLPPAEWEQASIVIERLQTALKDLETPKGKIKPRLLNITPYPEGTGILLGQDLDLKNILGAVTVVMLGFRNASVLSSTKGVIARPNTNDLGFHDLLMSITSKSGYKIDDIIEPVVYYKQTKDSKWLNPILRCTGADRQTELDGLIQSIDSADKEYWTKLTDWLDEAMPNHSSFVCFSGGTTNYFKSDLEQYAKTKMEYDENRLRWHTKVELPKNCGMSDNRFNDIYILWSELNKSTLNKPVTA